MDVLAHQHLGPEVLTHLSAHDLERLSGVNQSVRDLVNSNETLAALAKKGYTAIAHSLVDEEITDAWPNPFFWPHSLSDLINATPTAYMENIHAYAKKAATSSYREEVRAQIAAVAQN